MPYQKEYRMSTPQFVIIKDKKAPVQGHRKSGTSFWRDLYESMDVGDWFVLNKDEHSRVGKSANTYLRGRYRLYKNSEQEGTYIFNKLK